MPFSLKSRVRMIMKTNEVFSKDVYKRQALNKVASMAHNGYGRAIRPVHTMADGDSIYAVSVGLSLIHI